MHSPGVCERYARTIVELQHLPTGEAERDQREAFYLRYGRLLWLLHLKDDSAFHGTTFNRFGYYTLDLGRTIEPIDYKVIFS